MTTVQAPVTTQNHRFVYARIFFQLLSSIERRKELNEKKRRKKLENLQLVNEHHRGWFDWRDGVFVGNVIEFFAIFISNEIKSLWCGKICVFWMHVINLILTKTIKKNASN